MADLTPSPEVVELAARGRIIEAIRLHRKETGVGLAEAKAAVDRLPRHTTPATIGVVTQPERASRRAAVFLAATVLGLGGVAVTGTGLYRAHVASSWPQASGEIVRSRIVSGTVKSSDRVEAEYTFEVDGRAHRGSRISYTPIWGPFFTRTAASRYPVGEKVLVHYDPADPSRSVLEVRAPSFYVVVFIVSLMALAWGVARWVQEAQREGVSRDDASLAEGR